MTAMKVGGFTPLTTLDYPGELAAVVFCQGCPWRCRYCHNPELLDHGVETGNGWDSVLAILQRRRGLLDAVVFSGGEPTLQKGLPEAMVVVRELGFKVGLHTAGCYPDRLAKLLPLVDWVGLDIKALPEDYPALTGVPGSGERAWRSLQLLLTNGIHHEVRVTVHEDMLALSKLTRLLKRLTATGTQSIALQACHWRQVLDPTLGPTSVDWITPELLGTIVGASSSQLVLRV